MFNFGFLLGEELNKERQDSDKKDEENGLDIEARGREKRNNKENKEVFGRRMGEIGNNEVEKPREGAVELGESLEGDEKCLQGVEV